MRENLQTLIYSKAPAEKDAENTDAKKMYLHE